MKTEKYKLKRELLNYVVSKTAVDLQETESEIEDMLSKYEVKEIVESNHIEDLMSDIECFLSSKKVDGVSENTIKNYRIELTIFASHIKKKLNNITTNDIRNYLSSFSHLKTISVGTKLSILKSFFGWLVLEEIVVKDPTARIKPPKLEKRLPKGLSIAELEHVRECCNTPRRRAIFEIFYSTGCRLSEISNMDIDDINMQDMSAKVIGKGNKERIVYLSHKAIYHLKKYLDTRDDGEKALFVTARKPHRRMSNRAIQREFSIIKEESKIDKQLTPHVMRHTFATLSMSNGIDLVDLQNLLGHISPDTTLIYGKVSESRKKNAFRKYHVQ